jgi:GNAT superfamily N-acetyltransferase
MSTDSLSFRSARSDDLASLEQMAQALGNARETGYFGTCLNEQGEGRRDVIIVSYDGVDAAYGMINWQPQYALYRRFDIPEIQDLNTIPEYRRRGIAQAMITYFEDMARTRGCETVGIAVGLHAGFGAAQRIYMRMGYVPDGYGVTYDRVTVSMGEFRPIDDNLCLMMTKDL